MLYLKHLVTTLMTMRNEFFSSLVVVSSAAAKHANMIGCSLLEDPLWILRISNFGVCLCTMSLLLSCL